jgi:hypothetical protein
MALTLLSLDLAARPGRLTLCLLGAFACSAIMCSVGVGGRYRCLDVEDKYPSDTLSDWVTYAHQIAQVRVVSDRALPVSEHLRETGNGYQERIASMVVERTLWLAGDASPRHRFDLVVAGWVVHNHKRYEAAVARSPRIEVGDRLIMPLCHNEAGHVSLLSSHSVIPVGRAHGLQTQPYDDAVQQLIGVEPSQVSGLLHETIGHSDGSRPMRP